MKLKLIGCLAVLAMLFLPAVLRADVKDNANIFSKQAVDDANRDMERMKQTHNKEFVVETFAAIPDDQKDAYAQNKETFFRTWMASRAKALKVNGVYVLICMDPKHLEAGVGKNTREHGDFTQTDLDNLTTQMRASLRDKQYDKALSDAVDSVERAYTANINEPNARSTYTPRETDYATGQYRSYPTRSPGAGPGAAGAFGTIICTIVGIVIIFSLIRAILRGGGGGYSGGNYSGTYGSGYGGGGPGYGAGPGYGVGGFGGGGGGFGRGLLGGLLGGALGSYMENRWENNSGNNAGNQGGFSSGGGFGGGGGGGGGSSFDSGPSDAGQGFGDMSSGGDFGSSGGGGGDSGGGGGSSGGDF